MTLLQHHRALLEQWRTSMNLVGPGPVEEHYDDCAQALSVLPPGQTGRWADLGSGAGFPGIVFASLHPEAVLELVDSRIKRCVFLEHALVGAGPGSRARVRRARVEELESGAYDGVMARAFAPPAEVLAHAARLLTPGGVVVLMVGSEAEGLEHPQLEPEVDHRYVSAGRPHRVVVQRLRAPAG
ncbi:MAG: RsmG family class I SAM-dependent methyltransferase [Myxococcota bacterium]